jgi:CheY-like chemotaxis protein
MCRILVVDDEDEVRMALARRLEREGYTVSTAGASLRG